MDRRGWASVILLPATFSLASVKKRQKCKFGVFLYMILVTVISTKQFFVSLHTFFANLLFTVSFFCHGDDKIFTDQFFK